MRTDSSEKQNSTVGGDSNLESGDPFPEHQAGTKKDLNLLFLFQSVGWRHFWQAVERTVQCLPIFKDLFFIIRPTTTWNQLAVSRIGAGFILGFYLLPMMLATALIEGHGLILLGRQQVAEGMNDRFTLPMVFIYETGSALLCLILIFLAAGFIKSFANACHARNHLEQSLAVMFHSVGPMFLIQWFNGFPNMYYWLTWLFGVLVAIGVLYHGLPRLMQPDPPSAMGLYVGSAVTFFLLMLGWRILTGYYLAGNFKPLERFFMGETNKNQFVAWIRQTLASIHTLAPILAGFLILIVYLLLARRR